MASVQRERCGFCQRPQRVRADGRLAAHDVTWPVSQRAVRSVGAGQGRTRCLGSGQPPQAKPEAKPEAKP
jgi:hypothetical protein